VACQHLAAAAEQVCLQTAGASGVPREQWDLLAEVLLTYTVAIRGIVMVRERQPIMIGSPIARRP